ncbi:hypothetical protein FXN63_17195 [Pigmentiphaga aceris]|uniref:Uncharacterized protein n=1 Tax=Pigmentiphaga aceris TaxID=1940612 RepID=A0A5C0AYX9_9BURK|nr:hypothetical protein [Pigmentiphaga aceris]QEI07385.1 hypothetical protein FXN63_17195 [Pigmentiphaga aceris]
MSSQSMSAQSMSAQSKTTWLRTILPAPWLSLLNLVLFIGGLGMAAFIGHMDNDSAGRLVWLKGWAIAAAVWWLLMGTRVCSLVYRMTSLRLPGIRRVFWRGVLLHLAFSVGLPAMTLLVWQPAGADMPALIAALWLGSAMGFLIVSMPAAVPVMPALIIGTNWNTMATPVFSLLMGSFAMLIAGLAWRWHLGPLRLPFLAPFAMVMEGMSLDAFRFSRQASKKQTSRQTPTHATPTLGNRDLLAALLGRGCQTVRQALGQRAQLITYLVTATTIAAMLWAAAFLMDEQARVHNMPVLALMVTGLMLVAGRPASAIAHIHHARSAQLAELMLAPGMPPRDRLGGMLMRQVAHCLVERIALVSLTAAVALHLAYPVSLPWLIWWTCFSMVVLVLALGAAWLASQGQRGGWGRAGISALLMVLGTATNIWVAKNETALSIGWLAAWGGWSMLAAAWWLTCWRRVSGGPRGNAGLAT